MQSPRQRTARSFPRGFGWVWDCCSASMSKFGVCFCEWMPASAPFYHLGWVGFLMSVEQFVLVHIHAHLQLKITLTNSTFPRSTIHIHMSTATNNVHCVVYTLALQMPQFVVRSITLNSRPQLENKNFVRGACFARPLLHRMCCSWMFDSTCFGRDRKGAIL